MIQLSDRLWVGNSCDAEVAADNKFEAMLNVAVDLFPYYSYPTMEYAHIGLLDGPGNEINDYCATVLLLKALCRRHEKVLVYDHDGGRALVVVLMYLNLRGGQCRAEPTTWSHWMTWAERVETVRDKVEDHIPKVHHEHVRAFNKIPWGVLCVL